MPDVYLSILEAKKSAYGKGDTVYVRYRVTARGTPGTVSGFVDVYDDDTGVRITRYMYPSIAVGESYEVDGATVGKMPDHDWHLRFEAIP